MSATFDCVVRLKGGEGLNDEAVRAALEEALRAGDLDRQGIRASVEFVSRQIID
jgi:hypothetical protein